MTDLIKSAALVLAQAQRSLAEARTQQEQAKSAVTNALERATEVRRRMDQIRADREAGKITEAQAGGLFQIAAADEQDLLLIHRSATERHNEAIAATAAAQGDCDRAATAIEQLERRQSFDALAARVSELDKALINAVAELFEMGGTLGMPRALSSVWRPSTTLRNAVALGVPPQKASQ